MATPSRRTVQAPQTPCSQPVWTPVSPNTSRRQSSSVSRGSTSIARVSPLIVSSVRMADLPPCGRARIGHGADHQRTGDAPAIVPGGVQIRDRFDVLQGRANGLADLGLV